MWVGCVSPHAASERSAERLNEERRQADHDSSGPDPEQTNWVRLVRPVVASRLRTASPAKDAAYMETNTPAGPRSVSDYRTHGVVGAWSIGCPLSCHMHSGARRVGDVRNHLHGPVHPRRWRGAVAPGLGLCGPDVRPAPVAGKYIA